MNPSGAHEVRAEGVGAYCRLAADCDGFLTGRERILEAIERGEPARDVVQ
jgi:hypothetical protein